VEAHDGQVRKGTTVPYAAHLLGVAALVLEAGGTEDEAISALLHDVLEDHPDRATPSGLAERFGPEVARIVVACSDTVGSDPENKPPWKARKSAYLAGLADADAAVLLVSLADKLYNATALLRAVRLDGLLAYARFRAGPADQLWYHESLVATFRQRCPGPLTEEYAATVSRIRSLTVV